MSGARDEILRRVVAAAGAPAAQHAVARAYRRSGALAGDERVELFCRRAGEYRADVRRVAEHEVRAAISSACSARAAERVVAPLGLPDAWRPADVELVDDQGLSAPELDRVDGAVTGCSAAVADTGTIILTGGTAEGRRALSLVPDLHICVVREAQIVEVLPEALAAIASDGLERRPITFISGPSATSDIELSRVEGVHGPRTLVILVIKEPS